MGLLLVGVRLRGSHAATVALTGADTVCGVYLSPPEYRNPFAESDEIPFSMIPIPFWNS
jgi:hypothetical protein